MAHLNTGLSFLSGALIQIAPSGFIYRLLYQPSYDAKCVLKSLYQAQFYKWALSAVLFTLLWHYTENQALWVFIGWLVSVLGQGAWLLYRNRFRIKTYE